MKNFLLSIFILFSFSVFAQKSNSPKVLPLIPLPNKIILTEGAFNLNALTKLVLMNNKFKPEIEYFNNYLKTKYNIELQIDSVLPSNGNYIMITEPNIQTGQLENYDLNINENQILFSIEGNAGLFYGIQTLIQLLPIERSTELKISCVHITDSPGFKWRGMHLDCSRHFFTKDEVKKYIDYLAMYKFNIFHWHLTDDQGWRIEIKKYPLLTEISSKRKETVIGKPVDSKGKPLKDVKYDGKPYGGYYFQDDIKEIVAYALARHITIVPEIEMPGHSLAALAAYPQYSCTGGPFETYTTWGVADDVYCAGNDSTFIFIENILSEVFDLFPGKYIHIGGDECTKYRWNACVKCQKRIRDENLKDSEELQNYFISRVEKFVNSRGKQIIGWDEILEGGLAPNATVMSWRGSKGGIAAAKQNHFVIMTPGKPCYFDHYQSKDRSNEPLAIGGYNPLDSVYKYEPVPKTLSKDEQKFILGAQGNVWTEYITNFSQVEYMALPRMCALSEALWTKIENKNYDNFISRLKLHSKLLDQMNVNYAKHFMK